MKLYEHEFTGIGLVSFWQISYHWTSSTSLAAFYILLYHYSVLLYEKVLIDEYAINMRYIFLSNLR